MARSGSRRSRSGTRRASTSQRLTVTLLSNSTLTSTRDLLFRIFSDLGILRRKLESLEQILIPMEGCGHPITLQGPQRDVSHLLYQISVLEQTSRILKIACDRLSSQTEDISSLISTLSKPSPDSSAQ